MYGSLRRQRGFCCTPTARVWPFSSNHVPEIPHDQSHVVPHTHKVPVSNLKSTFSHKTMSCIQKNRQSATAGLRYTHKNERLASSLEGLEKALSDVHFTSPESHWLPHSRLLGNGPP